MSNLTNPTTRALHIPEILHGIARAIPTFPPQEPNFYEFAPFNLLPCVLVSKLWHQCFLPHLYHYLIECYADKTHDSSEYYKFLSSLRRHSHLFRRFQSYREIDNNHLPYDIATPPTNLVGLFLHGLQTNNMDHLLSVNQGPQLKELAFHAIVRVRPIELSQQCQEAITNLPCLEELDLKNWNINNELMANILGKCSSKLKILTLNSIAGFDEKLFFGTKYIKEDLEVTGALPPLQLTSLTNLTMLLDWIQSRSAIYFPILCPALQSLNITVDMDEHDVSQLIKVLQTYCPRLTSIEYHAGYSMLHEYGYYPKPHIHASLFKDSTSCLKSISTGLPHGLNSLMFDALLTHASTLEVIELRCRTRRSYGSDDGPGPIMERVQKLVVQCKNLKRLTLLDLKCPVEELSLLCVEPWECKNLESLTIEGYKSPEGLDRITKTQKMYHKQMRQNAWPRRLRHHEYRWNDDDDSDAEFEKSQRFLRQSQRQSGWFLKAGLTEYSFLEALLDYEVKRKLFSHLGKTSGLKNLRFIQLGKTEFFKDEQPFESPEDEKNEMEMEEDFVVDYRNVAMFKI